MNSSTSVLHVVICSALFDRKAEGVCTGRLVRALLDAGIRITLVTSDKAHLEFRHPNLEVLAFKVQPRDPKWLFRAWSRFSDGLDCNLYLWSRRAAGAKFSSKPALVYARAWPDSSLMAGYRIAQAQDLPLWMHLSDPFPPPGSPPLSPAAAADLQRVADRARICTFTNQRTVEYQRRFLRYPREDWAQVLPHISPDPRLLGPRPQAHRFCYIGTFSAHRDPLNLLTAFARYAEQWPRARLSFVGPGHRMLRDRVAELDLAARVDYQDYRADNREVMAEADVLMGLDNQVGEPLYSLTKIAEYLSVDRPVLHLVRPGGPDQLLIERVGPTAQAVGPESPEQILDAMVRCYAVPDDPAAYSSRFEVMRGLGAASAARLFLDMAERYGH